MVGTDENSFSTSWRLREVSVFGGGGCFWIMDSSFSVLWLMEMEEEEEEGEEEEELKGLEKK